MVRKAIFLSIPIGLAALALFAGCNSKDADGPKAAAPEKPQPAPTQAAKKKGDHEHKPGAHGGIIVEIGRDSYHAEAIFEKEGVLRLYTLGKDESRVQEIDSQTLTAYVKPEGGAESTSIVIRSEPQPGDSEGKTSQFIGKLPRELWGQKLEVTIPSIRIAGERFRLGFKSTPDQHHDDMPASALADEAEKKLYLTPGGKYTESDIKANGSVTASERFKGFQPKHDLKPKPGDKICPVTLTKANPGCTWIVGGKSYEFCCPPCVEEFVQQAKEHPEQVKEPEDYIKK